MRSREKFSQIVTVLVFVGRSTHLPPTSCGAGIRRAVAHEGSFTMATAAMS